MFLFFFGLAIFLFNVHHSVFLSVIWWFALVSMLYGCITLMPLFLPDSPYYTPLSTPIFYLAWGFAHVAFFLIFIPLEMTFSLVWITLYISFLLVILLVSFLLLIPLLCLAIVWSLAGQCFWQVCPGATDTPSTLPDWFKIEFISQLASCYRFIRGPLETLAVSLALPCRYEDSMYRIGFRIGFFLARWTVRDSRKAAEKFAFNRSSEIDQSILGWSLGALGEDDTLEDFFAAIPGFFHSYVVKPLKGNLPHKFLSQFASSWGGLVARNLLSNSVADDVKARRLATCMNAIKEIYDDDGLSKFLPNLSSLRFDQVAPSIHAAQILAPWHTATGSDTASRLARHILAKMLPYVRERDNDWIGLATGVYDLQEKTLHDHINHGDNSVLLAIFIHEARQVIHTEPSKWELLSSISKFDIQHTHLALQNEFCALWNESVLQGRDPDLPHLLDVLHGTHHLYAALHPSNRFDPTFLDEYPLCEIATHHTESTHSGPGQPDPPHHTSPRMSRPESTAARPGSTAAQQAEEANVTPVLPSFAGYITPNSQDFLPAYPIPGVT